jgi:ATP-dependent 26S proteasome regulatory subunit
VFAPGVLESVERQVVGIATHRERLRASGQHVKRGLLLYGPPGNGKTLIVRHLLSRLSGHTVVLLTGWGLQMIEPACALARMLQPSVVVLEDVDLVAMDRGMSPLGNPVLFELLNQMDGVAEDADVSFVLTTNRADLLEPALAARPGRIDLAVEIGLPDAAALRRLIELFGRGLDLRLDSMDSIVAKTSGVAASLVKELMRKAAVMAADEANGSGRLVVTDAHVNAALDELLSEGGALTRALIGGDAADDGPPSGPVVAGPMGIMPPSGGAVWAVTVGRQRRTYPGR